MSEVVDAQTTATETVETTAADFPLDAQVETLPVEDYVPDTVVDLPAEEPVAPVADPEPAPADPEPSDTLVDDSTLQADATAATDTLVLDDHTAAILTAQVAQAGSDSKEAAMLQPTLASLTVTSPSTLTGTVSTQVSDTPAKPSIPLQVANLEENAAAIFTALDALVAKLAPVIGSTPDVDGEETPADDKRPPLAGQLASVNGKLAHVLALINATTDAVEL